MSISLPSAARDAWWWNGADWQAGEQFAERDLRAGHYEDFRSIDELLDVLTQDPLGLDSQAVDPVAIRLRRLRGRR